MSSICQVLRNTANTEFLKAAWDFLYCIFQLHGFMVNLKDGIVFTLARRAGQGVFLQSKTAGTKNDIRTVSISQTSFNWREINSRAPSLLLYVSKYMLTRDGQEICFLVPSCPNSKANVCVQLSNKFRCLLSLLRGWVPSSELNHLPDRKDTNQLCVEEVFPSWRVSSSVHQHDSLWETLFVYCFGRKV